MKCMLILIALCIPGIFGVQQAENLSGDGDVGMIMEKTNISDAASNESTDWRPCFIPETKQFCAEQCNSSMENKCLQNIETAEINCQCGQDISIDFGEHMCKARCMKGFCGSADPTNCTCLGTSYSHYTEQQACNTACPTACTTVHDFSPEFPELAAAVLLCNWECPCQTSDQCQALCSKDCTKHESTDCFVCDEEEVFGVVKNSGLEASNDKNETEEMNSGAGASSALGLLPVPLLIGVIIGIVLILAIVVSLSCILYYRKRGASHNLHTRNEYHKQDPMPEVSAEPLVA